jgi:rRNA maturation protein Nop10
MLKTRCFNDNHGRAVVTVRFCSHCGSVVNTAIRPSFCGDQKHARMRRSRNSFCVDCGKSLVIGR